MNLPLPLASLILIASVAGVAHGHDWYDPVCCAGPSGPSPTSGDCHPIPKESVRPIAGGYEVTLVPGDHPRVLSPQHFALTQDKARLSEDNRYHACLYPDQNTLRCFYAPATGF